MRIVFRCDPALADHLPRPVPARAALPDWLRAMAHRVHSPTIGQGVQTARQCPPFIDAMAYGFMMTLACDVIVRNGALSWNWDVPAPSVRSYPRSPISFHLPEQLAGTPLHRPGQVLVKFNSFWTIELEPGWSLLATHPVNREDLPFRLLAGLVDADRFSDVGIAFPAMWTDPAFTGTLPRGTPVAQCFAVPRVVPDLVFESFSSEAATRFDATAEALLRKPGVYRRRFRARRLRAKRSAEALDVEP
jgi:hypothetical protein